MACSFVEATVRPISARLRGNRSARSRLRRKDVQVPKLSVHLWDSCRSFVSVVARPSSEFSLCRPRPRQYFVSATSVFCAATGISDVRRSSATATATAKPPHLGARFGASATRRPRLSAKPKARTAWSTKAARCVRDRRRTRDCTRPVRISTEAVSGARPPNRTKRTLTAMRAAASAAKYLPAQSPSCAASASTGSPTARRKAGAAVTASCATTDGTIAARGTPSKAVASANAQAPHAPMALHATSATDVAVAAAATAASA